MFQVPGRLYLSLEFWNINLYLGFMKRHGGNRLVPMKSFSTRALKALYNMLH